MKNMASLLSIIIITQLYSNVHEIKLESDVIKIADGTFINADKIEFIRKFRRKLINLLLGEQLSNGKRQGQYKLLGKMHTIRSLSLLEQKLENKNDSKSQKIKQCLEEMLTQAKADFIVMSKEFMESARGAKGILTKLIEEDCQKRNRPDSLLLEWARTKEGHEATMFEHRITQFTLYYSLCSDLVIFLMDLVYSCPKAEAQFKERVAKWSTVKNILPTILKKARVKFNSNDEVEFLKYIKERYLDHIDLDDITVQTILPLLNEYIKHHPITHA